jgi:hypothetical protein
MKAVIRRELEAAGRALAFMLAHPDSDASTVAVVARLQANITRADSGAIAQRDGIANDQAGTRQRGALRNEMETQLRHLARVGRNALSGHPELQGAFTLPTRFGAEKVFLTAARSMIASASAQEALLVGLGLGSTFVADLQAAVASYDATKAGQDDSKLTHIGARVDLDAVARDSVVVLEVLDGLNRTRFRNDATLLAEWQSARHVITRAHAAKAEPVTPAPGPVTPPATGGSVETR